MKIPKYAPWEFVPTHINFYELLQYPFEPIINYFGAATPMRQLQYLRNWRYCVLRSDFIYHKDLGPGKLVEVYSLNIKLIEPLYLLTGERMYYRNLHGIEEYEKSSPSLDLQHEKKEWLWYPGNLENSCLLSPYDYLNHIFQKYPPPFIKSTMLILLEAALSTYITQYDLSTRQINLFFDMLEKVCSIAWLINQRDAENAYSLGDPAPDEGIDTVNFPIL
jgi:hypothetical protein